LVTLKARLRGAKVVLRPYLKVPRQFFVNHFFTNPNKDIQNLLLAIYEPGVHPLLRLLARAENGAGETKNVG
jgi:hypothetical protein